MTTVDPETYYAVAKKLIEASVTLEKDLRDLDGKLRVARSAGTYDYGGPDWGQSFDQSASDAFEAGSLGAMAARELGYQIHLAGQNLARSENESHPTQPEPVPDPPQGTKLETNLHPTELCVGETGGNPTFWSLVEEYVERSWANCDEDRISTAGTELHTYGTKKSQFADQLYLGVVALFPADAQRADPILAGFVDEVKNVCTAIAGTSDAATYLGTAAEQVGSTAKSAKDDCRTSLRLLAAITASYEADKAAAHVIPYVGDKIREQIEMMESETRIAYAARIDGRLGDIETEVTQAVTSNSAIYQMVSDDTKVLTSLLERTPRNTATIRFRNDQQNRKAGQEGERRAGIDPNKPKRTVQVIKNGRPRQAIPDDISDENHQVTEVKNTNEIKPYKEQIEIETQWAQENGYTMTLVVDHRTKINDPEIQSMINSGQIEVVRKELDDNNDH